MTGTRGTIFRIGDWLAHWRLSALALVFGLLFVVIGVVDHLRARAAFDREMREAVQTLRVGARTALEVSEREMLHVAAYLASDPEIRRLLQEARAAVADEGMDGPRASLMRAQLMAYIGFRWEQVWTDDLTSAQLEFHLTPGAVNFLRVKQPRRYGDRLDDVRPLVATTHSIGMPTSGFEVGRVLSGVRGVQPVIGRGPGEVRLVVGSVEVGVAFREVINYINSRFDAEFGVTLARAQVEDVMWPDDIKAGLEWIDSCGCYLDAPTPSLVAELIGQLPDPFAVPLQGYRLERIGERWFSVARMGLLGYDDRLASVAEEGAQASLFMFADRTALVAAYRDERLHAMTVLAVAYLVVLAAIWWVLRRLAANFRTRIARAEEALDSARRFSSALFAISPDSVLVTDRDGLIVEVNPSFTAVTGYRPEEVLGRKSELLKSGQTPENVYQELWSCLLAGNVWRGDLQCRRKDGSFYWGAHAIVPVRDARGEIDCFVSFQRDVSEQRELERALTVSERLYRSIFDNVEEAIFVMRVESDGFRFVGNNPQHQRATGLTLARLCGSRPEDILPTDSAAIASSNYRRCVEAGHTIRYEEVLDLPAGQRRWLTALTPVRNDENEIEMIVGLSIDVTEQKAAEEELRRLATTDALTGLANRRHFLDRAAQEMGRLRRYGQHCAFMMLDVDHFKNVNDTWGHASGDALLRLLAGVLKRESRTTDLVGRLGGEEFAVLMPETGLDAALVLAERMRVAIEVSVLEVDDTALRFSASFGVTVFHADDEDVDMPMARADAALYAAKFAGRNRVKYRVR